MKNKKLFTQMRNTPTPLSTFFVENKICIFYFLVRDAFALITNERETNNNKTKK